MEGSQSKLTLDLLLNEFDVGFNTILAFSRDLMSCTVQY
jgi:hypothetical protein